jgi:flagellar transcriptional activator FlhC
MASKSVLNDSKQVERAVALIQLGARLQVLESARLKTGAKQ